MSTIKTMTVGRPKLPPGQKRVTWSFSIGKPLLDKLKKKARHGKVAQLANEILEANIDEWPVNK